VIRILLFNVGLELGQLSVMLVVVGLWKLLTRAVPRTLIVQRIAFGAMVLAGFVGAIMLTAFAEDEGQAEAAAGCSEGPRRSSATAGQTHPPKRWYGPNEEAPVSLQPHPLRRLRRSHLQARASPGRRRRARRLDPGTRHHRRGPARDRPRSDGGRIHGSHRTRLLPTRHRRAHHLPRRVVRDTPNRARQDRKRKLRKRKTARLKKTGLLTLAAALVLGEHGHVRARGRPPSGVLLLARAAPRSRLGLGRLSRERAVIVECPSEGRRLGGQRLSGVRVRLAPAVARRSSDRPFRLFLSAIIHRRASPFGARPSAHRGNRNRGDSAVAGGSRDPEASGARGGSGYGEG
jgi:hypothetical protein